LRGGIIEIKLTQGKIAQVDDEFEFLDQYKWYARKERYAKSNQYYAVRAIYLNGMQSIIRMHRVVMEHELSRPLLKTEQIDHINHDGLRNTLDNLRVVTHQQNIMNNRKQNTNATSQFKGVRWCEDIAKWRTRIQKDKKRIHVGYFITEEDAAHAYDTAAKLYFGKYAKLNFPTEE
jgi:hypothetical protein